MLVFPAVSDAGSFLWLEIRHVSWSERNHIWQKKNFKFVTVCLMLHAVCFIYWMGQEKLVRVRRLDWWVKANNIRSRTTSGVVEGNGDSSTFFPPPTAGRPRSYVVGLDSSIYSTDPGYLFVAHPVHVLKGEFKTSLKVLQFSNQLPWYYYYYSVWKHLCYKLHQVEACL